MTENDLLKQLGDLPREVEAKDQWTQIKTAIESQPVEKEPVAKVEATRVKTEKTWKMPLALAASFLLVAFLAVMLPKQTNPDTALELAQQKTLQSLQQANGQYYQALGDKMLVESVALPSDLNMTLKDLRQAQKSYRSELAQHPDDTALFKKLIRSYQTERSLLKQLLS